MAIHQLPNLARMRAFEGRFRAAADEGGAADLLCTEEGQWFFAECAPYTDAETRRRMVTIIADIDFGDALLGIERAKGGKE